MAIYHMSAQVIGRSAGRSATAAAAYRAGERIVDERTGEIHDYTRKQEVDHKEILATENAGEWAGDRAQLWNTAELAENRKNSQVAREINVAIPRELSAEQGRELVREYAKENFVKQGMIADICIHGEKSENPHAHIMLTMREADREGLTNKNRGWNDREQLDKWREEWAHCCNKSLEKAGHDISINHRSFVDQGIEREATTHLGPTATQIEREGKQSDRGEINREVEARNRELEETQKALAVINKELMQLAQEREEPAPAQQIFASGFIREQEAKREKQPEQKAVSASTFLRQKEQQKEQQKSEAIKPPTPEQAKRQPTPEEFVNLLEQAAKIKPLHEVRTTLAQLQEHAKPLQLVDEASKDERYKAQAEQVQNFARAEAKAADNARWHELCASEKTGMLQILEKRRLEKLAEEERQKAREARSAGQDAQAKLAAWEHNLTRPEGELAKRVQAHNAKAAYAAEAVSRIAPIYAERMRQEQQRERAITKDKERGGYER